MIKIQNKKNHRPPVSFFGYSHFGHCNLFRFSNFGFGGASFAERLTRSHIALSNNQDE